MVKKELENLCKKCKNNKHCFYIQSEDAKCDDYEYILECLNDIEFLKKDFRFDKLYLCSDSEYGTHVTYTNYHDFFLDYFTSSDSLYDIIVELYENANREKNKNGCLK